MSGFVRSIPNIITASRMVFAAAFVWLLYDTDRSAVLDPQALNEQVWKLEWAFITFVIAGVTDILDGPLARAMKVTSRFGRCFDPFVDKILVGGGFILLALFDHSISYVTWWMVGLVLAREILVTLVRSMSEARGQAFGASWVGKVKMFLQCFAVATVIMYMAHCQNERWAVIFRNTAVWVAVIFTAFSALSYLNRFRILMQRKKFP